MSVVDSMRMRLLRATELGVPSHEFLRHERVGGAALKTHVNSRVAQAGRDTEEAVRQLEHELDRPEEAALRLFMRQTFDD